jgi:hypothetical protein
VPDQFRPDVSEPSARDGEQMIGLEAMAAKGAANSVAANEPAAAMRILEAAAADADWPVMKRVARACRG